MIELIFAAFIGFITFIVTGIIVIGILILPLLFKGGWILYLLGIMLAIVTWVSKNDGGK